MKETRRSLLTSAVALLLCFVMLAGSTFAWFTDIAISSGNVIQSGNLDIALMKGIKTDSGWNWVENNGEAIFDYDKWEPGYTTTAVLAVENHGSLSAKWTAKLELDGTPTILADVIDIYVTSYHNYSTTRPDFKDGTWQKLGTVREVLDNDGLLLPGGTIDPDHRQPILVALNMRTDAGNDYQDKDLGANFNIKILATQASVESDSYDNTYDEGAKWPELPSQGTVATTPITLNGDGTLATEATMANPAGNITATLPAGVKFEQGTTTAGLSVNQMQTSGANITVSENEETRSYDVHIGKIAADNTIPVAIKIKEFLPTGLNIGNYSLYHVEDGNTVLMTLLAAGATPVHNNFEYDPATGDVTMYLASFSEIALVAEAPKWEGTIATEFNGGSGSEEDPYIIANADQLAYLSAVVGGMIGLTANSFKDKYIKLVADIDLNDAEKSNTSKIFYPIGYYNSEGTYERTNTAITSGLRIFEGTFDGNGHTVSNFYHNTWEMKGDHNWYTPEEQYYRDGMGLFGRVYGGTVKNLTVKNFSSDGEIATTGVIAAYADFGATFENIAIFGCNPRVYNIGNGGIVGCVGWYTKDAYPEDQRDDYKVTFRNITVDNSNKISALWGSYDVACGGIVGQYYPTSGQTSAGTPKNAGIDFVNCHIGAQMDVYNDVCGNYQYYAYRYAGMLIGSVRENETINGHSYPKMDGITAKDCTVHFGAWNDYYYCEFEKNGHPSYSGPDDYKFSRVPHSELIFTDTNDNGIIDTEQERSSVTGCKHDHTAAENNQAIYLPFNNLVTGYGWGVTSKWVGELDGVTILDREEANSVTKFEGKVSELEDKHTYNLGEIFDFVDNGVVLKPNALNVSITNIDENNPVSVAIEYNREVWRESKITFEGVGKITITIQDYYFCTPTTIIVDIIAHNHVYDNACDIDCNKCGATREVGDHVYDNACDATCNECGATREVSDHVYDNACDTKCNECGATREVGDHVYDNDCDTTCNECGAKRDIEHSVVVDEAVAPTCTATGLTKGSHCSVCNEVLVAQEIVAALGHTVVVDAAVAATCTTAGKTEGSHCSVCDEVLVDQTTVQALGHNWNAATCTAPKTCSRCDTTEGDALGHIETKFTGNFLYRVGNQNAVELSSLFNVGTRNVTVNYTTIAGNASVTVDGTSLEFNGTGIVKVTLTSDCTCSSCVLELNLEVVDATNTTGVINATSNNVVLLQDAGFSSLTVSGGYTLYGNGFTLTCGSDSYALDMGYSFVTLDSGILDNVQIVLPNFDHAVLYKSNMTESGNRSHTDEKGTTRYYNVKSGVMSTGNSQILNSRISGARAAVNVSGGNLIIDNSRIEGGAVANILVGAANSLTLRDVTLIQKPIASTYDSSKVLMGFSVLVICNAGGISAPITLEGYLIQNAWATESDKQYVPSEGQAVVSKVLDKEEYLHDIDGDGTNESVNLGIAYMPADDEFVVGKPAITDNRNNKNEIPYESVDITFGATTYVYSYKNTNGTDDDFKAESKYVPNKYSDVINVTYSDTSDGLTSVKSFGTNGWVYELNVDLDKLNGYKLDFSKLSILINGVPVTDFKVNGSAKPTSPVAVTAGGVTYTLTATIDGKTYTATYKVTGTETSKESPSVISANYQAGLCVASSYGGTWHGAAPALEGIVIKYWSVAESRYIELNLGDITIGKGQLNGNNTTWTYTPNNGDYTLTLTGGQVHSSNNVYAMPVGVDGTLYFVAANSKGLVNSGNSARAIPVSYTFKDNNGGDVLTFSHTWSVAENKNEQYKYSDFCNGTKTKLESCITADTLVTLADGTQKRIDELTYDDELLVWDFYTGKLTTAPISIIYSHEEEVQPVLHLNFSDGTTVKVISSHGFFDTSVNNFVYISEGNVAEFIGHSFVKVNGDRYDEVTLESYEVVEELTTAYWVQTAVHNNAVTEGMLSITTPDYEGWFDYFEITDDMKYDEDHMASEIEKYGLTTYEELEQYGTYEQYVAWNCQYFNILIGRGVVTMEDILSLLELYV